MLHKSDRSKRCEEIVAKAQEIKEVVNRLKLISNPTRFCIVILLLDGRRNVSEITEILQVQQPHISQSLRILEHSGILKSEREGKKVYYSIRSEKIKRLVLAILDFLNEK